MKKLLLSLACMFAVTTLWAAESTETINSIATKKVTDKSNPKISDTFGDITVSFERKSTYSPGFYNGSTNILRYYEKDVMTISSEYPISKIEFTMNSGAPGTADPTGLTGSGKSYTWSGEATSISFTGSTTVKIDKLVITYDKSGGKSDANLEWSVGSVALDLADIDSFVAPTLSKDTTADVSFASDNKDVADVTATGVISLTGAKGTATITATSIANDDYAAGEASCTITIYEPNYTKVGEMAEGKYIIAFPGTDATYYATTATATNYSYLPAESVNIVGDMIEIANGIDNEYTFTLREDGETFNIQDSRNLYIYHTKTYNNFNFSETEPANGWQVSISDGVAYIGMDGYQIQYDATNNNVGEWNTAKGVYPALYRSTSASIVVPTPKFTVVCDEELGENTFDEMAEVTVSANFTASDEQMLYYVYSINGADPEIDEEGEPVDYDEMFYYEDVIDIDYTMADENGDVTIKAIAVVMDFDTYEIATSEMASITLHKYTAPGETHVKYTPTTDLIPGNAYIITAKHEGKVYVLSTETNNQKTNIKAKEAAVYPDGHIYLEYESDHGHAEFFLGEENGMYYFYLYGGKDSEGNITEGKRLYADCSANNLHFFAPDDTNIDSTKHSHLCTITFPVADDTELQTLSVKAPEATEATILFGDNLGDKNHLYFNYSSNSQLFNTYVEHTETNYHNVILYTNGKNSTTGVENISVEKVENDAPVEYFNLQGVRVNNPQGGIFIIRQGNKASKVLR